MERAILQLSAVLVFLTALGETPVEGAEMVVPYSDFTPGSVVQWNYTHPYNARETIRMDFRSGTDDIPFCIIIHYGTHPRVQNVLSLNSYIDGQWGSPEWHSHFPFNHYWVEIQVMAHRDHFELLVIGSNFRATYTYEYRSPVLGIIAIHFEHPRNDFAIQLGRVLPHYQPGKVVYIHGTQPQNGNYGIRIFSRDPKNFSFKNVALFIGPRYERNLVIRSHTIGGHDHRAETDGGMPFTLGEPFSLSITCQLYEYEIAVNGRHFTSYEHGMPIPETATVFVGGELLKSLEQIQYF